MSILLKEYIKTVLQEGLLEPPPKMVDAIVDWMVEERKKYSELSRKGLARGLNVEKYFLIDLTGWKYEHFLDDYLKNINKNADDLIAYLHLMIKRRRDAGQPDLDPELIAGIERDLKNPNINDNKDKIKVVLKLASAGNQYGGTWQEGAKELTVYLQPTDTTESIRKIVEHELVHVMQTIISKAKKAKAGLPFKKPKNDESHHDLEDVEFYTVLRDEIKDAQKRGLTVSQVVSQSNFFKLLKKNDPLKWKKATRELSKALS